MHTDYYSSLFLFYDFSFCFLAYSFSFSFMAQLSRDGAHRESCSSVCNKSDYETGFKKPRIETPSPLPTFKVCCDLFGFNPITHFRNIQYSTFSPSVLDCFKFTNFAGEKREAWRQNHCSTAASLTFWKGKFILSGFNALKREKVITLTNLYFIQLFLYLKTDTASVLHEAIEYIKFLHDQVAVSIIKHYYY